MGTTEEQRPYVAPGEAFEGLTFAPMPEGTRAGAVFALVKLEPAADGAGDDFEWCVRTTGAYNRLEFLGALSAYVAHMQRDEARSWESDDDKHE